MFENFKNRMSVYGSNMGEALRHQSNMIMDATFDHDAAYRKCYILNNGVIFPEQTLDGYKKAKAVFNGEEKYDPDTISCFTQIEAKYLVHSYYSIDGDNVDYYLQFRPLEHGINKNIRIGAFIFIPDDLENYNLWMIVAKDDRPQFPQFYILKVNLLLKWYIGDKEVPLFEGAHVDTGTYYTWAVQRTQSSYNNGVWASDYSTSVENQLKAIVPTNSDTDTILYNEHFVIGTNNRRRIAWETSKLETSTTIGLTKLTFKQELEYDPEDNLTWINSSSENYSSTVTGIDYDFYCPRSNDKLNHDPVDTSKITSSTITYTGVGPFIKAGGGFKTFTANLYDNGVIYSGNPYWKIAYYKDDNLICSFNFIYVDDELVCDGYENNTITYDKDGSTIFGIKFKYDKTAPLKLKIKCLSILDMIGGSIILYADKNPIGTGSADTSLSVEVDGL